MYLKMELEKKKPKSIKKSFVGPRVKYLSTTMPKVNPEEEDVRNRHERTFITFTDPENDGFIFNNNKPKIRRPNYCPITR